ncbi:unnamed protein product [Chrysoparadoxa australica]
MGCALELRTSWKGEHACEFVVAYPSSVGLGGKLRHAAASKWWLGAAFCAVAALLDQARSASSSINPILPKTMLAFACVALLFVMWLRSGVLEESVLVIKGRGVRLSTRYGSGKECAEFLDMKQMQRAIINEGITMHRVVFYLGFVLEQRDTLAVAFPNLLPRLTVLKQVYKEMQPLLAPIEEQREANN